MSGVKGMVMPPSPLRTARKGLLGQLEDKFTVGDGCWDWIGKINAKGYGVLYQAPGKRPRNQKAHRVVYELLVGPIPEGLQIDHLCRNRACVNPAHLEPVTLEVNVHRGCQAASLRAEESR